MMSGAKVSNVYISLLPAALAGGAIRLVTSVGRLDKDTSGLILLTDQSALVHKLTSPKQKVPKVYRATLDADLPAGLAEIFAAGALVLDRRRRSVRARRIAGLSARAKPI